MQDYTSVFHPKESALFGLSNKKKKAFKNQLKATYGKGDWRDEWRELKSTYGGNAVRESFRNATETQGQTIIGSAADALGLPVIGGSGKDETGSASAGLTSKATPVIIGFLALVAIIFVIRKFRKK